jgi:hypothetical protein
MPNYKDGSVFGHLPNDTNFDTIHRPGQRTPFSGIYRCQNCGFEAVSTHGHPLPPETSCFQHGTQHGTNWSGAYGTVTWKLVAAAIHIRANA